jgi:phosphoenolpyruvate-protein kinase (PTS system EI component)
MEIGSEPSVTYRIVVANELAEAMIVSSDHAGSAGILGSVPAGSSDTFILARPASLDVLITARNAAGTRTVGPIPIQLRAGEPVHVRIR